MPVLSSLFNYADGLGRKLRRFAADPGAEIDLAATRFSEDQSDVLNKTRLAFPKHGEKTVLVSPEEKTQYQSEVAEAGTTMGGMFLPYIKGLAGAKGLQTPQYERLSEIAMDMLRSGKDPTTVGKATGMFVVPRGGTRSSVKNVEKNFQNGAFMVEVPDDTLRLLPNRLAPNKQPKRIGSETWARSTTPSEVATMDPRINFADVRFDSKLHGLGQYDPSIQEIALNTNKLSNEQDLLGVLRHEGQHFFQEHAGGLRGTMPSGGSPSLFSGTDKQTQIRLGELLNLVRGKPGRPVPPEDAAVRGLLEQVLYGTKDAHGTYTRLLGEMQANATKDRGRMLLPDRKMISPYHSYLDNSVQNNTKVIQDPRRLFTGEFNEPEDLIHAEALASGPRDNQAILDILRKRLTAPTPPR